MKSPAGKIHGPDFVVRLVGRGIRPWAVPLRALARVLQSLQRLVDQKEEIEETTLGSDETEPQSKADTTRTLRLLEVVSHSAGYAVAAPNSDAAIGVLAQMGKSIKAPTDAEWSGATLSSLEELSEVAKSLGCKIEFRYPGTAGRLGNVIAKITPDTFDEVADTAFVHGQTSIVGRIERVGGATKMHCGLRLPNRPQKMLICRVATEELTRDLGQYMYKTVVVSGVATWYRYNWQIKSLRITSFEPPKTGSIRDTLQRVYDAGGRAWDRVKDPESMIAEIRGA